MSNAMVMTILRQGRWRELSTNVVNLPRIRYPECFIALRRRRTDLGTWGDLGQISSVHTDRKDAEASHRHSVAGEIELNGDIGN